MKKVILFGATGNLGKAVAKELRDRGFELTVVVRSETKTKSLAHLTTKYIVADACRKETLSGICADQQIVISTLGKSISPVDRSKPSFREVDLHGNLNILEEAKRSGVSKFIYVSAFHAERYLHLEYFNVHHEFSEALKKSGIDYTIIKPPAIFSAFVDLIAMARKGQLVNIGLGDKKTNPIFEGDLAKLCVDGIAEKNKVMEAGGKTIYTRKQLIEIVKHHVDQRKAIRSVPIGFIRFFLPIMKIIDSNMFDKMAFFIQVLQHDTIAPQLGETTFEAYVKEKATLR